MGRKDSNNTELVTHGGVHMWEGTDSNNTELVKMVEFIYREEGKVTIKNCVHIPDGAQILEGIDCDNTDLVLYG
jgi:hypothetical protein